MHRDRPLVVLLIGLTGSGKTTVSRQLEARGLRRLSVDEEVHRRHGRYGIDYREDEYPQKEQPVLSKIRKELLTGVAAGVDQVLDHGLWTRAERQDWSDAVSGAGGRVLLVHLPVSREELLRRLGERNRREDANALTVTPEALDDFIARFEPPGDDEDVWEVDGDGGEIAGKIVARVQVPAGPRGCAATRSDVLLALLRELRRVRPGESVMIAIDGFDGAGKTHLAQELVELAAAEGGRPVVRVSIDGFLRPRRERREAGSGADGFYRGSYGYDAFRECVVEPLRGGKPIVPAVWDVAADRTVSPEPMTVPVGAVVLVEGIFLQRPELADVWDAAVWVDVPFEVSVPRGGARFPGRNDPDPGSPANERYVGGQTLYLAEASPREKATWVLENSDLERPVLRQNLP